MVEIKSDFGFASHLSEKRAVVGSKSIGFNAGCGYTGVVIRLGPSGKLEEAEAEFPDDPADFVFGGMSRLLRFIDMTGAVVTSDDYDGARSFSEGLAAVKKGEKWGYIDKAGVLVIAPQFGEALSYSDGFAAVKSQGKWGYIDQTGRALRIGSK
ncbi:MAG: WG repeat-containing protein [Bryobacteraceae bacterium]